MTSDVIGLEGRATAPAHLLQSKFKARGKRARSRCFAIVMGEHQISTGPCACAVEHILAARKADIADQRAEEPPPSQVLQIPRGFYSASQRIPVDQQRADAETVAAVAASSRLAAFSSAVCATGGMQLALATFFVPCQTASANRSTTKAPSSSRRRRSSSEGQGWDTQHASVRKSCRPASAHPFPPSLSPACACVPLPQHKIGAGRRPCVLLASCTSCTLLIGLPFHCMTSQPMLASD